MCARRVAVLLAALSWAVSLEAADKKPLTVDDMWAVQRVGTRRSRRREDRCLHSIVYDMEENRGNATCGSCRSREGRPAGSRLQGSDGSPA